jgi:hypothetical protein
MLLIFIIILVICVLVLVFLVFRRAKKSRNISNFLKRAGDTSIDGFQRTYDLYSTLEPEERTRAVNYIIARAREIAFGPDQEVLDLYEFAIFQEPDDVFDDRIMMTHFMGIADNATPLMNKVLSGRAEAAREISNSPQEFIENYLEERVDADPQNVHDTSVVDDNKVSLNKIIATSNGQYNSSERLLTITRAKNIINASGISDDRKIDALKVLSRMSESDEIIGVYGRSEMEILYYVLNRINDPMNAKNKNSLEVAFSEALADSVEWGSVTCTQGRTSRLLGLFALLDFDSELGSAATLQMYKNEIFADCKKAYDNRVNSLSDSGLRDYMLTGNGTPDADALAETIQEIKKDMYAIVDEYVGRLRPSSIDAIKMELDFVF